MRINTIGMALFAATALVLSASAQTMPTAPAITRTIVAATKLPSVVETPLYFKAVRVTLQPGGKSSLSAADGILYQLSGSTEISLGGENKVLGANEALFVAAGKTASLNSGSGQPSILLYFLLVPAAELGRPTATAPARIHSPALSRLTPPVGISLTCGSGALTSLMNWGPRAVAGNTLPLIVKTLKSVISTVFGRAVPAFTDHSLIISEKSRSTRYSDDGFLG